MMSRYRAPQQQSSPYITCEGKQRIEDELKYLWGIKRPEVTRAVSEAAAQGDRSENAEYIYGKKQLREIDSRVHYLRKRLDQYIVVDQIPADTSRIYFGAWFHILDDQGCKYAYRIVGSDELNLEKDYISIDSPLARAVIGKTAGDRIRLHLPQGESSIIIECVEYR